MSLQDHPKAYGAAALTFTFAAGILVTLGFKDLYPDLERRFQDSLADSRQQRKKAAALRRTRSKQSESSAGGGLWRRPGTSASAATSGSSKRLPIRRQSSAGDGTSGGVILEDHESDIVSSDERDGDDGDDWSMLAASSELPHAHVVTAPPVADGIAGCIGNTPLIRIKSLSDATGCDILAKAELLNPGGSPKDRVALNVIRAAEARGLLVPFRGDTIYEGTVGSTGISIATLARALGYRAHICMPNDQSLEKSQLLREMGAVVQRVPVTPIVDPAHYVNLAKRLAIEHEQTHSDGSKGFFSDQFETPANAEAHRRTTGPEILRQVAAYSADHRHGNSTVQHSIPHPHSPLAAFVCGAGTAGTLTGVARYLKEDAGLRTSLRVVAADPQGSGLFNLVRNGVLYAATEKEGTRRRSQVDTIVEGIGMNRMTATLEAGLHLIDDAVSVTDKQACLMARWLVENEGIFAGSSSAVNCVAAVKTALTLPPGSRVVTVLCDSGLRHLSKFYKKVEELNTQDEAAAEPGTDLLSVLGVPPRKE
ncbi:cysteine synthase 2 [Ophiostoma piceae UAMH 11346]|uniref:cysteine synthase n=1 Tax=Ophiostoma piceae (strain UAMH 11346) TaxID=1262450 RepID=S3D9R2_OPHP1|nr:cysteine synthase 2 [Ophiostoma piceae UAMH 11346]